MVNISSCVVYILLCSDDTYYTGWTNNIEKRLKAHNGGTASKYTRIRRPLKLVYLEECLDKSSALKREYAIKQLKRAEKINLIENYKKTIIF